MNHEEGIRKHTWLSAAFVILVGCAYAQQSPRQYWEVGDGKPATRATVLAPTGLAVDRTSLYIVQSGPKRVRRVDLRTGIITTVAGGGKQCEMDGMTEPTSGCLGYPQRVAVGSHGDVYITDEVLKAVIKIGSKPASFSFVTKNSGGSPAGSTLKPDPRLEWPSGIAIDSSGILFLNDQSLSVVFRVSASDSSLEIIAGTSELDFARDGRPAKGAKFRHPDGLARDNEGDLFIADYGNCRIQKLNSKTQVATTIVGTQDDGSTCESLPEAGFTQDQPADVAVDQNGHLFFVQPWRCRVRRIDLVTGVVTTVAGIAQQGFAGDGGAAIAAKLHYPQGIALDSEGNLYIADTENNRVRRVDSKTGLISTVAGHGAISEDVLL